MVGGIEMGKALIIGAAALPAWPSINAARTATSLTEIMIASRTKGQV